MRTIAASILGVTFGSFASCTSSFQVASACEEGDCTAVDTPLRVTSPTCTLGTLERTVGVNNSPNLPDTFLQTICLPHRLPELPDGRVECVMRAKFETDDATTKHCRDVFRGRIQTAPDGSTHCILNQLSPGEPAALQPPGFYYDSESVEVAEGCSESPQRVGFVPDNLLYILEHFTIDLHCEFASANLGAADVLDNPEGAVYLTTESCSAREQKASAARHVGDACQPSPIYADGFDSGEIYLDPHAPGCGTGVCMAYHIDGSIAPDCNPASQRCADERSIRERVSCTCRCSADDPGDAELCGCPIGFSCEPILQNGPAAGGYCVAEGVVIPHD